MSGDAVVAVATFLAAGCAVTAVAAARSPYRGPVVTSFAVHLLVGFAVLAVSGLYAPDAATYDRVAREYAAFWQHSQAVRPTFTAGKEGWVLILANIYHWFGATPALGIIFNVTLTGVMAALVMATTVRLGWGRHARAAGWLTLLPGFLLWSSLLLRESVVWTLMALAAWAAAGLARTGGVRNTIWLLAALAGMLSVRGSLAAVIGGGLLVGVLLARRRLPPALLVGLVAALVVGGPLVARAVSLSSGTDLHHLNAARASLSRSGSGFETTSYSTPASLVEELPLTMPRTVLGPYPWELRRLPRTALVDWVPWMLLMFWTARGWRRSTGGLVVAVPALCLIAVIAATSGNYGTMVRLRPQVAVLLLPLAAAGAGRVRPAPAVTPGP